jgi:predicted ATPase
LYLLDEPEAALSPMRQIELACMLDEHVRLGSQLIIATHSPILLAVPAARICRLNENGLERIAYEETENFRLTRDFLRDPQRFFRET